MLPYLDDMALVYACADMVVSRAGALSLAEIYASGLPSILVPYPYAAADHQTLNALASERAGASRMIEDAELTSEKLLNVLRDWVLHPEKLESMSLAAKSLAKPNATSDIVAILKLF